MHVPKLFQITNKAIIEQFIKENGFATVISMGSDYPIGTHMPPGIIIPMLPPGII